MGKCFYCFFCSFAPSFILFLLISLFGSCCSVALFLTISSYPLNRIDRHHSDEDREITYCKSIQFLCRKGNTICSCFQSNFIGNHFQGISFLSVGERAGHFFSNLKVNSCTIDYSTMSGETIFARFFFLPKVWLSFIIFGVFSDLHQVNSVNNVTYSCT